MIAVRLLHLPHDIPYGKLLLPANVYGLQGPPYSGLLSMQGSSDFAEGVADGALENDVCDLARGNALNKDGIARTA